MIAAQLLSIILAFDKRVTCGAAGSVCQVVGGSASMLGLCSKGDADLEGSIGLGPLCSERSSDACPPAAISEI